MSRIAWWPWEPLQPPGSLRGSIKSPSGTPVGAWWPWQSLQPQTPGVRGHVEQRRLLRHRLARPLPRHHLPAGVPRPLPGPIHADRDAAARVHQVRAWAGAREGHWHAQPPTCTRLAGLERCRLRAGLAVLMRLNQLGCSCIFACVQAGVQCRLQRAVGAEHGPLPGALRAQGRPAGAAGELEGRELGGWRRGVRHTVLRLGTAPLWNPAPDQGYQLLQL